MRKTPMILFAVGCSLLALLLSGCGEGSASSAPVVLLPTHIRKIAVRPIVNKTQYFGLEDKLKLRVEEEFIRDGRIPYINNESEADGVVVGEIVNYIKEPVTYDNNQVVEEYKLWVLMDLKFVDRVNKVLLWEEPRLEQEYRYYVETKPGGVTEEEARVRMWDLFSRDIVRRTVDGFGAVSGASEKKAPSKTLPGDAGDKPPKPPERPKTPPPSPY